MITKKWICLLLALLLLAGLAGCGAPQAQTVDPAPVQPQPEQTQPEQPQPEQTPTEEPVKLTLELPEAMSFRKTGEQAQLYEGPIALEEIRWESGDTTVAAVENGLVTAMQRGQTTVTAFYEDQSVTCAIDCDLPVPMIFDMSAGERDPLYLPPNVEIVDDSFFDDALFIGDSQSLSLYSCSEFYNLLGDAKFMARNSYSVDSAANNKMLLSWRGQSYAVENAIKLSGAKKVFFMLGVNDVAQYGAAEMDMIFENWNKMLDRIEEVNPDVMICLQSIFYCYTGGERKNVNNEVISQYNIRLEALAEERGHVFIDVASWMLDSTGGTAKPYSSDEYVHVNAEGVDVWIKVLKACTDYE